MIIFTEETLPQMVAIVEHAPIPSPDVAGYILWNETAFPVCGLAHAIQQLHEFFDAAREGFEEAMADA